METIQQSLSNCDRLSLDQLRNIQLRCEGVAAEMARLADIPQLRAGVKKRRRSTHQRHNAADTVLGPELAGADLLTVLNTMLKKVGNPVSLPLRG